MLNNEIRRRKQEEQQQQHLEGAPHGSENGSEQIQELENYQVEWQSEFTESLRGI